ncbi:MAG: hypothetical protein P8O03_01795 [Ilumatobacter sp.]|jgi:hypothetical protein|nr:hypothetical protein [Ilumatobacter sp.]
MSDYWASGPPAAFSEDNNSSFSVSPSSDLDDDVVYPPYAIVGVAALVVVLSAALFVPSTDPAHWLGYGLGAFGSAVAVIAYRHVDLRRQRFSGYVSKPWAGMAATALLSMGIALGLAHAYFALQTKTIQ